MKSRFSRWFKQESPEKVESRRSSVQDDHHIIKDLLSDIGETSVSIPGDSEVYFAPISPAGNTGVIGGKRGGGGAQSQPINIMEMLQRSKHQGEGATVKQPPREYPRISGQSSICHIYFLIFLIESINNYLFYCKFKEYKIKKCFLETEIILYLFFCQVFVIFPQNLYEILLVDAIKAVSSSEFPGKILSLDELEAKMRQNADLSASMPQKHQQQKPDEEMTAAFKKLVGRLKFERHFF